MSFSKESEFNAAANLPKSSSAAGRTRRPPGNTSTCMSFDT